MGWLTICGGPSVIGMGKVITDFGVHEPGLPEGGIRPLTVGGNIEALAGRVVQVGGEFAFPEVHKLGAA